MPYKDPQEAREYQREYYKQNREHKLASICANQKANRSQRREYETARYQKIRDEVISHYGGACACCGEANKVFLQIDHINGGGNEHRREIEKNSGGRVPLALWLKRNNFPDGFQVLCANCNIAKHINGVCPHKLSEVAEMTTRLGNEVIKQQNDGGYGRLRENGLFRAEVSVSYENV